MLRLPLFYLLRKGDDHRASILVVPRVGVGQAKDKLGILDKIGHMVVATAARTSTSPFSVKVTMY